MTGLLRGPCASIVKTIVVGVAVVAIGLPLGGCVSQQQQQNNKAAYNALPAEFRTEVRECEQGFGTKYNTNTPESPEREAECVREAQGKVAERKRVLAMPMSKEAREAVEAEKPGVTAEEEAKKYEEGKGPLNSKDVKAVEEYNGRSKAETACGRPMDRSQVEAFDNAGEQCPR